jgi:glycogen operon protein
MDAGVLPGRSYPLGATVTPDGVNFSVFSRNASEIHLLLFDRADDPYPARVIELNSETNRTFYYWHVFVPGLRAGQVYAYRAFGPYDPATGMRFDGSKVLLDPYAKAVASSRYDHAAACRPGDNCAHALRAVVVDPAAYDWEGDAPLGSPRRRAVIYELHVGGFTKHPSSGLAPARRGTFAGLIDKIPYLQSLGVNVVELMPVQQFDPHDTPAGQTNYWGYSPVAFFAPHNAYAVRGDPLGAVDEFRDMVKALHRAGIAVVLDVVFNHTAECGADGPTLSLRGLENNAYYIPGANKSEYANYSGCGNTVNANHSIVRRLIRHCLHYWVHQMHVDGFRFDLASALARGEYGEPLYSPPILWSIESDPMLAATMIFAEAWDAGGLHQVGSFVGDRFAEWNSHFRDDIRSFVKGDPGMVVRAALRMAASPDLYPRTDRDVRRTVNFVTCHDGFTLNDLVSYNEKHNQENGENNNDGHNDNRSWNCGVEGPADDAEIEALRLRQIKNFYTILLMSQGTPMLGMGDEIRRTQHGNNNAFNRDVPWNWFDWADTARHHGLLRFVRELLHFHNEVEVLHHKRYLNLGYHPTEPYVDFHGVELYQPDWGQDSHSFALTLCHPRADEQLHVILNAYWEHLTFALPPLGDGREWRCIVDTYQPAADDIHPIAAAPPVQGTRYTVGSRSAVVLLAMPFHRRS